MEIDHIAIWVQDLEKVREFYQRYFGMECNDKYTNPTKGFSSYFLSFADGARIEIMHRIDLKQDNDCSHAMGLTHIAISVGSKNKVVEVTNLIRRDGYKVIGEPRTTGDGYYESVIADPEGNRIEITE